MSVSVPGLSWCRVSTARVPTILRTAIQEPSRVLKL